MITVHCTSFSLQFKAGHFRLRVTTALDIVTDALSKEDSTICVPFYYNIIDNLLVIAVSTNILWKVQISTRKKLALAGICSLTALIMCISAIRISLGSSGGRLDDASYVSLGGVEIAIGKCLPEQNGRKTVLRS